MMWDAIVVGGGFYGAALALSLKGQRVLLIEREAQLLSRASWVNQARVHNGYHYPRSLPTALASAKNYKRFCEDYADCIDRSFEKVYAIAAHGSKTSAAQYRAIYELMGLPIEPASQRILRLFSQDSIEAAFVVEECAFNAEKLRSKLLFRLVSSGIRVHIATQVERIGQGTVHTSNGVEHADRIILATYAGTNNLLEDSGLPALPLKHEVTEVCLIEPPEQLKGLGVTVMDGEFFSVMPFPATGSHSLTHVTYTPQAKPPASNYQRMARHAAQFLPCMRDARYQKSLFDIKTVLQQNEVDDGRPVLVKRDYGFQGLTVVLGGKFDNVYDVTL